MQDFLEDIQEIIPKITKRKAYFLLCSIKGRVEKYWKFGIWKRDGHKFGISERQMQKFIALLRDYWYINKVAQVRGSRGFMCSLYKVSSVMKEFFNDIRGGIKTSNLTDRIKQFNISHNTFDYLRGYWVVKYTKCIIQDRYIVHKRAKGKYKDYIFDSEERKPITLFEFLRIYNNRTLIEQSRELGLIW